jgi:hypothetical protein
MDQPIKLKSSWEELKEKLKETHIELTDSDLEMSAGNEDDFLYRIAQKLKKTPGEVKDLIESISANHTIAG